MKDKPSDRLKTLEIRSRAHWRQWLERHHDSSPGVWLVFYKRHTGRTPIEYESAVEEALCFGWVDSLIKRLDEARYVIKITPRKPDSVWSDLNRRRYAKVKAEGLLAPAGASRPPTARRYPSKGPRSVPVIIRKALGARPAIERELKAHKAAWRYFGGLSPFHRLRYIVWIGMAKRDDTRRRRLREAIERLAAGQKLGLK
jgi:uncharacterized protein YdeI (YjbR/CyaY-like superfamily)